MVLNEPSALTLGLSVGSLCVVRRSYLAVVSVSP